MFKSEYVLSLNILPLIVVLTNELKNEAACGESVLPKTDTAFVVSLSLVAAQNDVLVLENVGVACLSFTGVNAVADAAPNPASLLPLRSVPGATDVNSTGG